MTVLTLDFLIVSNCRGGENIYLMMVISSLNEITEVSYQKFYKDMMFKKKIIFEKGEILQA